MSLPEGKAYCECGEPAFPVYQSTGYRCPVHGYLTHDAIVYKRSTPMEEVQDAFAIYIRDDIEGMVIHSIHVEKSDAMRKAGELVGAFSEVSIVTTTIAKRHDT